MSDNRVPHHFKHLIIEAIEGTLPEEDRAYFNKILIESAEAREFYIHMISVNSSLHQIMGGGYEEITPEGIPSKGWGDILFQEIVMQDIERAMDCSCHQPPVLSQPEEKKENPLKRHKPTRRQFKTFAFRAVALLMICFVILWVDRVVWNRSFGMDPVAKVIDKINCQWNAEGLTPTHDGDLYPGKMKLTSGFVTIQFPEGAQVVIEAPAEFDLETQSQMYLAAGSLSCRVPKEAIGFRVRTDNSTVIDLGTEFGVRSEKGGTSELHMFKGKASLIAGKNNAKKNSEILVADQAASVEHGSSAIQTVAIDRSNFVRSINSRTGLVWRGESFSLADLIGKGNGFGTGAIGYAINPKTGETKSINDIADRTGNGQYAPVYDNPMIDGVFVPDRGAGPVMISTEGHVFEGCPDTNNVYFAEICNGLPRNVIVPDIRLGNQVYGTRSKPCLFMHANVGITFDLDRIRQQLDWAEIASFKAKTGIASTTPNVEIPHADFWVLVDGQDRYHRLGVEYADIPTEIEIPINPSDRYLTLICTDGGDTDLMTDSFYDLATNYDYCLFAEPFLELE